MGKANKNANFHGWVLLDKPIGISSSRAVQLVRKVFDRAKAGHIGTLDPFASGLLPIAVGEATKTIPYIANETKGYEFTVKWGATTPTLDSESAVCETSKMIPLREDIEAILPQFTGEISQIPPQYSAVHVGGVRAYTLAREGRAVEIPPRDVVIHDLSLTNHEESISTFHVICSKGTYVRAIARDMAVSLGTFGYVTHLRRTIAGQINVTDAVTLDALNQHPTQHLHRADYMLDDILAITIPMCAVNDIRQGRKIVIDASDANPVRVLHRGLLVSIGRVQDGFFYPKKVCTIDV